MSLSDGLRSIGMGDGRKVALVFCDDHRADLAAALESVLEAGAEPCMAPPIVDLAAWVAAVEPTGAFVCGCEAERWRRAGGRGPVVGDHPGMYWSKALALR